MAKRFCCPDCFGDYGLRTKIFPTLNPAHGACDFCGTTDTQLIDPIKLADYFEMLVDAYKPDADGRLLVEWMKDDWQLFSHQRMDIAHAKELLGEILDNGEIVRKKFLPSSSSSSSEGLAQWDKLRDEMMYGNRWFLNVEIDLERLSRLLGMLLAVDLPQKWYRARISVDGDVFSIDQMGAPPKRRSSHGRANPAGIPYLYLGSKPDTAIAEIRPHTGELACVADFTISSESRNTVVDLRNPRSLVSPFILTDASEIGQLRADLPFLERLGEELTRPVQPSGAAIDYIPSQYLCEFIKKCNFHGVAYRSSVSDGINLALFSPERATGGNVSLYNVEKVSVCVGVMTH